MTETIDFVGRYADKLIPTASSAGGWRKRAATLTDEIDQGPENTVAGFVYGFNNLYVNNIKSLLATGDYAQAKSYYDKVLSAVSANRRDILSISQISGIGAEGDSLAKTALGILKGDFNQEKVTLRDGSEVSIGAALADGSPFLADKTDEMLDRFHFTDAAVQLYMANDHNIRSIMDPLMDAARGSKGGVEGVQNGVQLRGLAEAYAENADRVNGIFGEDGARTFLSYVKDTHRTAGNAAATMRTLVDFAETYSNATGRNGSQLASEVVSGYNDLVSTVFRGDPDGPAKGRPAEITDTQRRTFDAMFIPAVRTAMEQLGGGFDLHDPSLRQSLLETGDVVAYATAINAPVIRLMREAGSPVNKMFGEYVVESMTNQAHHPDNIVTAIRNVRDELGARLTGGRNFATVASSLSGREQDYLSNAEKVNGTKSMCPAADGLAADAHSFLAREMITGIANNGASASDVFTGIAKSSNAVNGLAQRLVKSFHGRGRDEIAQALARGIVAGLASGRRVNIEDMVADLSFGDMSRRLSSSAVKTARTWYHGNVASQLQFSDYRTALREKYLAEGYNDAQARRAIASVAEQASRESAAGGDPYAVWQTALDVGLYLTEAPQTVLEPVYDKDGKPVMEGGQPKMERKTVKDKDTGMVKTRVVEAIGPRSKRAARNGPNQALAGDFVTDRAGWDALQRTLTERRSQEIKNEIYEQQRRIAQEAKQTGNNSF